MRKRERGSDWEGERKQQWSLSVSLWKWREKLWTEPTAHCFSYSTCKPERPKTFIFIKGSLPLALELKDRLASHTARLLHPEKNARNNTHTEAHTYGPIRGLPRAARARAETRKCDHVPINRSFLDLWSSLVPRTQAEKRKGELGFEKKALVHAHTNVH